MLKRIQPYWEFAWWYVALWYFRGACLWWACVIWLRGGSWPEDVWPKKKK
jgi:hypothetical protein